MSDRPEDQTSQPLNPQYKIGVNLITLHQLLSLDAKWFYKLCGRLTSGEVLALLASSDRLIEILKADTIRNQETKPLDRTR